MSNICLTHKVQLDLLCLASLDLYIRLSSLFVIFKYLEFLLKNRTKESDQYCQSLNTQFINCNKKPFFRIGNRYKGTCHSQAISAQHGNNSHKPHLL